MNILIIKLGATGHVVGRLLMRICHGSSERWFLVHLDFSLLDVPRYDVMSPSVISFIVQKTTQGDRTNHRLCSTEIGVMGGTAYEFSSPKRFPLPVID